MNYTDDSPLHLEKDLNGLREFFQINNIPFDRALLAMLAMMSVEYHAQGKTHDQFCNFMAYFVETTKDIFDK